MNRTALDGFAAALLAVESFTDGHAVLHGPGGCRNYNSFTSSQCFPRKERRDNERFYGKYFFGNRRLPCTYVDEYDYINGTKEKLMDSIPIICDSFPGEFCVFVQSPGVALIGDNITDCIAKAGYSNRAAAVNESLISQPFAPSYDHTVLTVLKWMHPARRKARKGTVNILGLPITANDWSVALEEFRGHLESMGLEVISAPGAGCSSEELRASVEAEFNVVIQREYCRHTADYYRDEYGIECIECDQGAPVGFDALESWIDRIAEATGADPEKPREKIMDAKRRAFRILSSTVYLKSPKYRRFSVVSESSVALPLTRWLFSYLFMMPAAAVCTKGSDQEYRGRLSGFLEGIDCPDAMDRDPDGAETSYLFADGQYAALAEATGLCDKGIDIGLPSLLRVNFLSRPIFGIHGAMYLLDEIFRRA